MNQNENMDGVVRLITLDEAAAVHRMINHTDKYYTKNPHFGSGVMSSTIVSHRGTLRKPKQR
jgi:hypothetical protein